MAEQICFITSFPFFILSLVYPLFTLPLFVASLSFLSSFLSLLIFPFSHCSLFCPVYVSPLPSPTFLLFSPPSFSKVTISFLFFVFIFPFSFWFFLYTSPFRSPLLFFQFSRTLATFLRFFLQILSLNAVCGRQDPENVANLGLSWTLTIFHS